MRFKRLPSQEKLRELFTYKNNQLYWKESVKGRKTCLKPAGCIEKRTGYRRITIGSYNRYIASRLIWVYHYGEFPEGKIIDHLNRIRDDNRLENLRLTNHSHNVLNSKTRESSDFKGIFWRENRKKWVAFIGINYKTIYLGHYKDKSKAITARKKAEKLYGVVNTK